ncbi:MAG TPA: amidohydrolase [Planctomycetaceae bacterium]|nr:amidohydrolase [Planctomycetaceae bacterium]
MVVACLAELRKRMSNPESQTWYSDLVAIADSLCDQWRELRRQLHQHPELSGQEFETTQRLAAVLDGIGIAPQVIGAGSSIELANGRNAEGRGLIADFVSSPECAHRKKFAIRGDIDALPISDSKAVSYRSQVDGVMHACGHDVHASVVVGAMQILHQMHLSGKLPWDVAVRAIFQPAEEIAQGARYMIAHDVMHEVESVLALHVDPTRAVGKIGLLDGPFTAACDIFEVRFSGKGGHGARPHLSHDAIDAASAWVQAVYRCVPRVVNPHETIVISIGQMEAGHSANVIPDEAVLRGSLRSLDADSRLVALSKINAIGDSIFQQTGCEVAYSTIMSAPAVINDKHLVERLGYVAERVIDPAAVEEIAQPSMGSEDFSFYLQQHAGAMYRLGVAGPQIGHEPLHTPNFDVDERAIAIGAKLMAAMAIDHFAA